MSQRNTAVRLLPHFAKANRFNRFKHSNIETIQVSIKIYKFEEGDKHICHTLTCLKWAQQVMCSKSVVQMDFKRVQSLPGNVGLSKWFFGWLKTHVDIHDERFTVWFVLEIKWCLCIGRSGMWICHLPYWSRDKTASISQKTFSSAFSLIKMFQFRLRFHWSLS